MNRIKRIWLASAGALLILAGVQGYISRNYLLIGPGPAEELSAMVTVETGTKDASGAFLLTAVTSRPAGVLSLASALFSPTVDIIPRGREIPPGMNMEKYLKIMENLMRESQAIAGAVALRKLDYRVEVESVVRIEEVLRDSPAKGLLEPGDVILAVDEKPVKTADETVKLIGARRPGTAVGLVVRRDGRTESLMVRTAPHPEERTRAAVGVLISPSMKYELPVKIEIDTRDVKGSSAGLMFALEILNQLDPHDLTSGAVVAGTGTIGLDGTVGPIAGVKQKIAAAERAGAAYFLVPADLESVARRAARNLQVIGVSHFDDALAALDDIVRRRNGTAGEY